MRVLPLLAFAVLCGSPSPVVACELKLLLSWDVSASMSARDYDLQRGGTAEALRHPTVQNMVALNPGGVAVSVLQWAGENEQDVSIPWVILRSNRDAQLFADAIESMHDPFDGASGTAIGASLEYAVEHLDAGPVCARTVIDISGDGISNVGRAPESVADYLQSRGVTINGLVLPHKVKSISLDRDPFMHYVRHVARGPESFVMFVDSYEDFPRAMRHKLMRELAPRVAMLGDD